MDASAIARPPRAAVLDVDGTLVDSVYHHALAWHRAFRDRGFLVPAWRLHRHVGMGGDRYVRAVLGDEVERLHGDALREAHSARFRPLMDEVAPLPGAREFLRGLRDSGIEVALASSARPEELERYVDILGADDVVRGEVSAEDADTSKPAPDIFMAALAILGHRDAIAVGDATWDCIAASRAGIPTACVLTGGFSVGELREAGAVHVSPDLAGVLRWLRGGSGPEAGDTT